MTKRKFNGLRGYVNTKIRPNRTGAEAIVSVSSPLLSRGDIKRTTEPTTVHVALNTMRNLDLQKKRADSFEQHCAKQRIEIKKLESENSILAERNNKQFQDSMHNSACYQALKKRYDDAEKELNAIDPFEELYGVACSETVVWQRTCIFLAVSFLLLATYTVIVGG